jgi:hypothetical protein
LFVGAKVVCVDASTKVEGFWNPLTLGDSYVVRDVSTDPRPASSGDIVVCLEGHANPNLLTGADCGYRPERFKPIHDNSKTIEALKQAMRDAAQDRAVTAVNTVADDGLDRKVRA